MSPPPGKPARVILHIIAGLAFISGTLLVPTIVALPHWGIWRAVGWAIGVMIASTPVLLGQGTAARLSTNLAILVLSTFLVLALLEGTFRLARIDLEAGATRLIPIYYRQPVETSGRAYFRRSGPAHWVGQILNTRLQQLGVTPNPYRDEPVRQIDYDSQGFRNSPEMTDWVIAIAGDSFTELGYLPHDRLFTTLLGRTLGIPVLNLGTSYTGPLTQLSYLQDYGIAPSTRHVMIAFFEGNDLLDLEEEAEAVNKLEQTGQRPYRNPQYSPLRALARVALDYRRRRRDAGRYVSGYFQSPQGEVPVTLQYAPPGRSQLKRETLRQLEVFLRSFAQLGQNRDVSTWLAFMPSKERVFYGRIRFTDHAPEEVRQWRPTDLPDVIGELCLRYGIRFVNLTDPLTDEIRATGRLMYNSIYDNHLSELGSEVVAKTLARVFAAALAAQAPTTGPP